MIEQLPLPLFQRPIYLTWYSVKGGIGVTARTDESGQAFIGIYPLDGEGLPSGRPTEYPRARMTTGIAVGYLAGRTETIFADIEITKKGLSLRVNLPPTMSQTSRYLSSKWGSKLPPCWMDLRPIQEWLEDLKASYSLI